MNTGANKETKHKNYSYIQFPICLMQGMILDYKQNISNIITYGIYKYTLVDINIDECDAVRQCLYDNYRGDLRHELKYKLNNSGFEWVGEDQDYNGFSGYTFQPDEEINELTDAIKQNERLKQLVIENYKLHLMFQSFGKVNISKDEIIQYGETIDNSLPAKSVFAMIKTDILLNYLGNEKTNYEVIQLAAFIAFNSIIGTKKYSKTNYNHIMSRAFGYGSIKEISEFENTALSDVWTKYQKRYHREKLLSDLEIDWKLKVCSTVGVRGFYISIANKISYDELMQIAIKSVRSNKVKELKDKKKGIRANHTPP
jgi:hypothetical protein